MFPSLAVVFSRACLGLQAPLVTVETHLSNGLPSFSIVGLPETAVKESKDRVRSAILNSNFEFPVHRITVNLAPADLPKEGARYDLPIALGILAASGQIPVRALETHEFAGELALSGELRMVRGALPFALQTAKTKRALIVPWMNANEALLVEALTVYGARTLLEVCAHLTEHIPMNPAKNREASSFVESTLDFSEVKGQSHAKRAVEIAATGGHNLLMIGPPGTGKTMLASRLPSILPLLNQQEAIEVAAISSLNRNEFNFTPTRTRPFRNPHHTASAAALVGGGSVPKPGEVSLAHLGVLFLDELPEFGRQALEVLREPMEANKVTIARALQHVEFPAQFQLIAAMNPCPCGYFGDATRNCRCTPDQMQRYQGKLSGPFLDRFDILVDVPRLPRNVLQEKKVQEDSTGIRKRVMNARHVQQTRAKKLNAALSTKEIERDCMLTKADQDFLVDAAERLRCSPRAYHRILRVARTIADLALSSTLQKHHLTEALYYRTLEKYFG